MVNLSKRQLTADQAEVLALGLAYCPERPLNLFDTIKDLNLFVRKLTLKQLHHKSDQCSTGNSALMQLSLSECRELRDLLFSESQDVPSSSTQDVPSSPTQLLEALMDNLASVGSDNSTPTSGAVETSTPVGLPMLAKLKRKSKIPPPINTKRPSLTYDDKRNLCPVHRAPYAEFIYFTPRSIVPIKVNEGHRY